MLCNPNLLNKYLLWYHSAQLSWKLLLCIGIIMNVSSTSMAPTYIYYTNTRTHSETQKMRLIYMIYNMLDKIKPKINLFRYCVAHNQHYIGNATQKMPYNVRTEIPIRIQVSWTHLYTYLILLQYIGQEKPKRAHTTHILADTQLQRPTFGWKQPKRNIHNSWKQEKFLCR